MVSTIKNDKGYVAAFVEYYLMDGTGRHVNDGEYLFVNECWVHDDLRHKKILNMFINRIVPNYPSADKIYFVRRKYDCRLSLYDIRRDNNKIKLIKKEKAA